MPTNPDSTTRKDNILVVDDEVASLSLLTEILAKADYRVRPANTPVLAIESALALPPDLILLDVRMPEMSGFEVCRRLQQDERTRGIPIIFVSALRDVEDRIQGFEAGGVDFISKPFQELEVKARVKTHLQLRRMQLHLEDLVSERTAELTRTYAELRASEERFRATFEQAAVGIAHVSPKGNFLMLNQRYCDILGYSQDEMRKLTFQDITHPDDLDTGLENVQQLLDGKNNTYFMEKRYIRKKGIIVWVNLTVSLLRGDTGKPRFFVAVAEDITQRKRAEERLKANEDRLSGIVDSISDSMIMLDKDLNIVWANDVAKRLFGPMILGKKCHWLYHGTEEPCDASLVQETFQDGRIHERITDLFIAGGDKRIFECISNVAAYDEKGEPSLVVELLRDITARRQAEQKLQEYQHRLKSLASQLTVAEERERRRLAADLHDQIGQTLALARIQLAAVRKSVSDDGLTGQIDELSESMRQAAQDTQDLVFDLSSPSMNELGLAAAISEWLEEKIGKRSGLKTEFVADGHRKTINDDERAILFRNVRELLTNVVKHARANRVSVSMEYADAALKIVVRDDGIGFDNPSVSKKGGTEGGFGLFSIQERMTDLGGVLEIESEPGEGFKAILIMPVGKGREME